MPTNTSFDLSLFKKDPTQEYSVGIEGRTDDLDVSARVQVGAPA